MSQNLCRVSLEADPSYGTRKAKQEADRAKLEISLKASEAPLITDLTNLGIQVESVWELVNTASSYQLAIPLLLDHLQRPYPDAIRDGIARALAIRATRSLGWQVLVDEYLRTEPTNSRLKDGLAVALAGASDDSVIQELIGLARDKNNGESRVLLLLGIKRSRRPEAKQALTELAEDPQLEKEITSWRRKRR